MDAQQTALGADTHRVAFIHQQTHVYKIPNLRKLFFRKSRSISNCPILAYKSVGSAPSFSALKVLLALKTDAAFSKNS